VRAIRIHETGRPEVMRLEEVDLPPPANGQVRLRHHAVGVNCMDVYQRIGFYPASLPFTLGSEGAGEVGPGSRV
jgi:NADPH2:quinone reductase